MNITITEFDTPFSFFCRSNDGTLDPEVLKDNPDNFLHFKNVLNNVSHGQYVAVFWKNKWLRGVVSMESQLQIWLVDYGLHLRPTEKTVVLDLPAEYKKYPTKVFEASIHGVVPMDKELTDDCMITNKVSLTWNPGSIERAQTLIQAATKTYFVPIALFSTKHNDVVIGDLYLKLPEQGLCSLADELEMWPMFLEKNGKGYIEKLSLHYTTRRKHRACPLKPKLPHYELPTITVETSFLEYNTICQNSAQAHPAIEDSSDSEDGSTAINVHRGQKNRDAFRLSPEEIEKYASMHVKIFDQTYNALHLLLNKIKDLNLCERYKDYDLKSVGRGYVRNRMPQTYIVTDDL